MKWFKRFFKTKIYLPIWFAWSSNPTDLSNEEYYDLLVKITDAHLDGKTVILRIDGHPHILEPGKKLRKLERNEYEFDF